MFKLMIKLLLGLGNPGRKYTSTRHNLGYILAELLAKKKKAKFKPGKGEYVFAQIKIEDKEIILIKPQTFVNQSGIAAKQCLEDFDLDIENLLVLCDDTNLPLGKIRIRPKGVDGGHNGLKSIIYQLSSLDFARLRMGVGPPPPNVKMEDYVLDKFRPEEEDEVEEMLKQASLTTEEIISLGVAESMNRFN